MKYEQCKEPMAYHIDVHKGWLYCIKEKGHNELHKFQCDYFESQLTPIEVKN